MNDPFRFIVFTFLPIWDIYNLSLTCSTFSKILTDNSTWKFLLKRDFHLDYKGPLAKEKYQTMIPEMIQEWQRMIKNHPKKAIWSLFQLANWNLDYKGELNYKILDFYDDSLENYIYNKRIVLLLRHLPKRYYDILFRHYFEVGIDIDTLLWFNRITANASGCKLVSLISSFEDYNLMMARDVATLGKFDKNYLRHIVGENLFSLPTIQKTSSQDLMIRYLLSCSE